jgi:proprotein convertase subtilisin/kexin type 5
VRDHIRCVSECSEGKYENSSRICRPCSDKCKTCSGPDQNNCLSCDPSNTPHSVLSGTSCVD